MSDMLQGVSMADAAMRAWQAGYSDGDGDLNELSNLRALSYQLAKENPMAISGVNTHVTEVIGTGLELQCRIDRSVLFALGLDESSADKWESLTENRFKYWCENKMECDAEGQSNFYELQGLGLRTEILAGDAIAITPNIKRKHAVFKMRVQMVDPSRLSNPHSLPDTTLLAGGVGRDQFGYARVLHILKGHPNSKKLDNQPYEWEPIEIIGGKTGRINAVHIFDKLQAGASRGRPLLAPIIKTVKQMGRYTDAEVAAAVVNAFFAIFTQSKSDGPAAFDFGETSESEHVNDAEGEIGGMDGSIVDLPAGRELVTAEPGRPNDKFDGFMQAMMKQIGMALDIPLEILTKHFQSSYSAARAALLQFWKTVLVKRKHMALGFCQPIYGTWLMEEVAAGRIEAPGFFTDPFIRRAWSTAAWVGPPRGMIRPDQEVQAELDMNAATIKPLSDITLQLTGNDWDASVEKQAREMRKLRELGLDFALPDYENRQKDDREDD